MKVFFIMPFDTEFLGLYEYIKSQFPTYDFKHAGDLDNQQNILKDIVEGIHSSDIIIADLTSLNPNVFYELGICHALGKKVISITQALDDLPFDIRAYRANQYNPHVAQINFLIDELKKLFNGAENNTIVFGSPVSDFISIDYINQGIQSKTSHPDIKESDIENGDKGLLDFIAEIEEDVVFITNELECMMENMKSMVDSINLGTDDIYRVKKNGGSGTANFTRGIARKVAESVSEFDNNMKNHNNNLSRVWSRIENNCLDLIDNKFMVTSGNKDELIILLRSLYGMQNSIIESNQSTSGLIDSFSNIRGIERRLNQSVNSLETQMNTYLAVMDNAVSSIDRIIEKGKTLVGEIDFSILE